jgi:hypothetical protein
LLYVNPDGTRREMVDTATAQTITGDKTFTGTVVMSGAVTKTEFADGTFGAPSVTFSSDLDCGLYRIGTNNIGAAVGGAKVLDIGTTGLGLTGAFTPTGRVDLSSVNPDASHTDGGVIKAGTSGAPVTEDTANFKFVSMYFDCGATSGDAQGLYNRLYITGAGGGGDALRAFGTVLDVAGATARGAHISLSYGASGTTTGMGAALETTLHMPSGGGMAGTNYSIKAAINADAAGSDPAGATTIAFMGFVAQGTQAGIDDLEDDAVLFDFQGFTADADATHLYSSTSLAELPTGTIGFRCKVGSALFYLPLVAQAQWN